MNRELFIKALLHSALTATPLKVPGNSSNFSLSNTWSIPNTPLVGKSCYFLGSSITYGAAANGVSFPDYLAKQYGLTIIKEAVSATTLADKYIEISWPYHNNSEKLAIANFFTGNQAQKAGYSYLARFKKYLLKLPAPDLFVCQLSTNDSRNGVPIGKITPNSQLTNFDTTTTLGAIETLCATIKQNWNCPLTFYTCPRKDESYHQLIRYLQKLQSKWHFNLIDLANNAPFLAKLYSSPIYMADDAHPTMAGYKEVWTPFFYQELVKTISA